MATDNLTPAASATAIDNEFQTYRAVSPLAVLALLLGLVSLLCFASLSFLLVAVAAFGVGVYADRKIQRLSDVLTGRKLAQAGAAMGLVFGLGATTTDLVQSGLRKSAATRFASDFLQSARKDSLSKNVWYRLPPSGRVHADPETAYDDLIKAAPEPHLGEMQVESFRKFRDRLASSPQEEAEIEGIEGHGLDGLDPYAGVLIHVHGPGSAAFPAKEEFALLSVKGQTVKGKQEWYVDNLMYPYKPNSFERPAAAVDDGHGHGGGGHGH